MQMDKLKYQPKPKVHVKVEFAINMEKLIIAETKSNDARTLVRSTFEKT